MAVTRVKTSSLLQGMPKDRSFLAGNEAYDPTDFESIATVLVGSGGAANVEFTSIPSTYTHLQIRALTKSDRTTTGGKNDLLLTFNSSTSSYAAHALTGAGASTGVEAYTSDTKIVISKDFVVGNASGYADMFGVMVLDILDYKSTDKNKTIRALTGADQNGAGAVALNSGLWYVSPVAITSIKFTIDGSYNFKQYSRFALYGIKG